MIILPFIPSAAYYRMSIQIDGVLYLFDVHWNSRSESWAFDISESDGTPIANGIPIVLGTYLGRMCSHQLFSTGVFVATDVTGQKRDASFDDLGTRVVVQRYSTAEVVALKS